ncbi:hypothetical protein NXW84_12390 [Bacteroides fragilis]|nr:hypothetical protein NXW84_12390 [Bacteroides fragilis]
MGRGIGGTFETPYTAWGESENGLSSHRNGIETGYLDLILKGGICYLFLLVSICFVMPYIELFPKAHAQKGAAFFFRYFYKLLTKWYFYFYCFYLLWYVVFLCLKKNVLLV